MSSRRNLCLLLTFALIFTTTGCSTFKSIKSNLSNHGNEFEVGAEVKEEEVEKSVFDSERERQTKLTEYVAKTGRSSKSNKKLSNGDTFLMSDKAKEIYANTER
jgi:arsenate reductase-like glutaredoxin family protein